jgi:DNA-binding NarL/FixJ family response regulator
MTIVSTRPLRIAIVDDHPLTRMALRGLIESQEGWLVACECASIDEMLNLMEQSAPDVAIIDLCVGNEWGYQLLQRMNLHYPHVRTVVFSAHPEHKHAAHCIHLGAAGFISKVEAVDDVRNAIQVVANGGYYVTHGLFEPGHDVIFPTDGD